MVSACCKKRGLRSWVLLLPPSGFPITALNPELVLMSAGGPVCPSPRFADAPESTPEGAQGVGMESLFSLTKGAAWGGLCTQSKVV